MVVAPFVWDVVVRVSIFCFARERSGDRAHWIHGARTRRRTGGAAFRGLGPSAGGDRDRHTNSIRLLRLFGLGGGCFFCGAAFPHDPCAWVAGGGRGGWIA